MNRLDEIVSLLRELTPTQLEQVRAFIHSLRDQTPRVDAWRFDFIERFHEATHSGLEVKIAGATCAGVTRPALWEHPPASGSATIGYVVMVPSRVHGLKMKFAIGIRDGSELPTDRFIAFRVMVNGYKVWSTLKNSHAWESFEIALPQLSSDVARIELITDGMGDNRWNWAVWGEPRLQGDEPPPLRIVPKAQ